MNLHIPKRLFQKAVTLSVKHHPQSVLSVIQIHFHTSQDNLHIRDPGKDQMFQVYGQNLRHYQL